jgi:hypothetical protein
VVKNQYKYFNIHLNLIKIILLKIDLFSMKIFKDLNQTTFAKLFLRKKFIIHRVLGLAYLLQYIASVYYYNTDY